MRSVNPRVVLISLLGLSFVATVFMVLLGGDIFEPVSYRADTYSRSIIGHRAFLELLERTGRPALLSRAPAHLAESSTHVAWVAEPSFIMLEAEPGDWFDQRFVWGGQTTVVILPERSGIPSTQQRGWISLESRIPPAEVDAVLERLGVEAEVERSNRVVTMEADRWGGRVELRRPQLLRSEQLRPLVSGPEGILIGEQFVDGHRLVLVSDPELVSNDGLGRADHAAIAMALVDEITVDGETLLVDASLQGFPYVASVWSELVRLPLALATIQVVLLGVLALWLAFGRFGRALRESHLPPPGKEELIDSTARLMVNAGHAARMVRRYAAFMVERVGGRLHAPRPADAPATARWLANLETRRTSLRAGRMLARAELLNDARKESTRQIVSLARDLARWRREMLSGPRSTPGAER